MELLNDVLKEAVQQAGEGELGVGVDCEDVARWRALVEDLDDSSAGRLFHESEHAYCRKFADPAPVYAGRWCAKEAVLKALSQWATFDLRAVRIEPGPGGRPVAVVDHPIAERVEVKVSIAHTANTAMAVAVARLL
ncbi:MAG: holo-ACP synthase [Actinomycetota bacterium]